MERWIEYDGETYSHETTDGTRAEPDGRPLSLETPVEAKPGDAADGSREVGDDEGGNGSKVGGESGSSVET
jgi:hypothetical protein